MNELMKKKKGGNEGGRRKRTGVVYNMKPTKSLESSISGLAISWDHRELVGHILGHRQVCHTLTNLIQVIQTSVSLRVFPQGQQRHRRVS